MNVSPKKKWEMGLAAKIVEGYNGDRPNGGAEEDPDPLGWEGGDGQKVGPCNTAVL